MKYYGLIGPTGIGKTELSIKLANSLNADIINVDSALIYCDMDIGTAKPSEDNLKKIKHYLIDIIKPSNSYSVYQYLQDVKIAIKHIENSNKNVFFVGGSMMYFKTLINGISVLPKKNIDIRNKLYNDIDMHGLSYVYDKLYQIDPIAACNLNKNDKSRVIRALEINLITNKNLHQVFFQSPNICGINDCIKTIALLPSNKIILYKNIQNRFMSMCENGFIDEVIYLQNKYSLNFQHQSMQCIGYKQALQYVNGILDYDDFIFQSIVSTKRLIKKQITWINSFSNKVNCIYDNENNLYDLMLSIFTN